jgi:cholesterol oxidase
LDSRVKAEYQAIVIGTGFGGSVAACRLAQAGFTVGVFERGRRYDINPFPRDWKNPANGWLWQVGQGLFDIKHFSQMMVIEGAGLGGGSLIYANVHLRAPHEVFNRGWPESYTRAALDPYYDLVAYMLDINPITASKHFQAELPATGGLPPKSMLMKRMADAMGRSAQFCFPNIAVDFNTPNVPHLNKFKAEQRGCIYCGECDIGCNVHAKNTLDFNYLKIARDRGADIDTQCEVVRIEPLDNGGYRVTGRDHKSGGQLFATLAKYVFVCAGAVNSTELLLRCRDQYHTLPGLSERLGCNYSGNGDFLAFAFNTNEPFEPSRGPTITTGIVYSRQDDGANNWFIFEEGGYPKEVGALVQVLNPKNGLLKDLGMLSRVELENLLRKSGAPPEARAEADHSAVFLAMGRDSSDGRISLHPLTFSLEIEWNRGANAALYDAEERFSKALAQKLGGDAAFNPFWQILRLPVSVHNLGGCPLGAAISDGVADANGEVFNYPGLFVTDGAAIPTAIGANPSHTIAAVAERNVQAAIRKYGADRNWSAPEAAMAPHIDDPLSDVTVPPQGVPPLIV